VPQVKSQRSLPGPGRPGRVFRDMVVMGASALNTGNTRCARITALMAAQVPPTQDTAAAPSTTEHIALLNVCRHPTPADRGVPDTLPHIGDPGRRAAGSRAVVGVHTADDGDPGGDPAQCLVNAVATRVSAVRPPGVARVASSVSGPSRCARDRCPAGSTSGCGRPCLPAVSTVRGDKVRLGEQGPTDGLAPGQSGPTAQPPRDTR